MHETRAPKGGGGDLAQGGGGRVPPPNRLPRTNRHNRPSLLCLTMVQVRTCFAQRELCTKHTDSESQPRQIAARRATLHTISIGVCIYMGVLVRALSCRAPCAQRLPNDAQARFPSKPVTAANPLSMNHDMHAYTAAALRTTVFVFALGGGGGGVETSCTLYR